jgi:hypothetical protein
MSKCSGSSFGYFPNLLRLALALVSTAPLANSFSTPRVSAPDLPFRFDGAQLQVHEGRKAGGDPGGIYGGDPPADRFPHDHRSVIFSRSSEQRGGCTISVVFNQKGNVG